MKVAISGAGGFLGGHLVKKMLKAGHYVTAVDQKPFEEWYQLHTEAVNLCMNLRDSGACMATCVGQDWVFDLAADMGGIGFIESHKWDCSTSVISSVHMLAAAAFHNVGRFFFSSSACAYPRYLQGRPDGVALKESDAYPADCEDGYGWQKLYSERLCAAATEDLGLTTRVARLHNIYGPHGTYNGGREKAPAAICRKVAEAVKSGAHEIEIWGDGEQTRSFCYVDDAIEGFQRIMESSYANPLNLGSSELVTVNKLVTIVEDIAGIQLHRKHLFTAPQGVRGRNSDNTLIKEILNWEPTTSLRSGLEKTYEWIASQLSI